MRADEPAKLGPDSDRTPEALLLRAVTEISGDASAVAWRTIHAARAAGPRSGRVQCLASRLLYLLGDYHGALEAARSAVELGVAPGSMLSYTEAHTLGRHHEARACLESLLRTALPTASHGDPRDPLFERALELLLQLHLNAHHDRGATAILEQYLPLARGSAALYLLAARAYERGGETNKARDALRVALAAQTPAPSIRLKVAALQLDLGCFDEARAIYEELLDGGATALPACEALGRLCLWTGDLRGALTHAERLAALDRDGTAAPRITAAVMVLQQNHAAAVSSLDRVLSQDPRDGEAYLWRAEAQLFLGRNQAALRDALRSVECGYSFAAAAMHLLAGLVRARRRLWPRPRRKASPVDGDPCARYKAFLGYTPSGMIHDRWQRLVHPKREHGAVTHARRELVAEITEICADAAAVLAKNDARALIALLERSLAALSGNRTPLGTWVRADGTLARLPRSVSARVSSRQVMELIRVAPADEVFRCFDELLARFPDSSMPLVHRGELQLWLGRYAEARADLEGAIAVLRQTRWAWYGLACLDLLAGDAERALATCALGIRVMHNTEGPVAFLYRGEAYRLLRRFDAAREQLQHSCALNPTRLSSWINLALVHSAAGGRAAQADIFRRLVHVAPGLISEAARGLGEDTFNAIVLEGYLHDHWPAGGSDGERMDRVLQQALTMMRGNRSSSCITYFTGDGQLCHVPLPGTEKRLGVDTEGKTLVQLRDLVKQALADATVRESKG